MDLVKPRPVLPGALVGIVAPASAVDRDRLETHLTLLESWGYRTRVGEHVLDRWGGRAGRDEDRLADFHSMWADPQVEAILCSRGGYGSMRLLDRIDWGLIRRNPKFFCGFSDVTALHMAIRREVGLVTFHGPMAAAFGAAVAYNAAGLLRAMQQRTPLGTIPWPARADEQPPRPVAIRPGVATGRLVGGNLSLLTALLGTPWEPDLAGCILLAEDVSETPDRVDRMLTQLRLAGRLRGVRGVLFGDSPDVVNPDGQDGSDLMAVLDDRLGDLGIPVLYGFPCGHTAYRATLPLGVEVRLDATAGTLTILESALAE